MKIFEENKNNKDKVMEIYHFFATSFNDEDKDKLYLKIFTLVFVAYILKSKKYVNTLNINDGLEMLELADDVKHHIQINIENHHDLILEAVDFFYEKDLLNFLQYTDSDDMSNELTPMGIMSLSYRLLNINAGEIVGDFCTGTGGFIQYSNSKCSDATYYGYELSYSSYIIATLRSYIMGRNIKIENLDILHFLDDKQKFDKIFSHYPFNIKQKEIENETYYYLEKRIPNLRKNINSDWLINTRIINSLKSNGKAVVIMPNGDLFNTSCIELRRFYIENGYIETIISLPARLFKSNNIECSLVVLSYNNETVKFVDATEICEKNRRMNNMYNEHVQEIINILKEKKNKYREIPVSMIRQSDYNLYPKLYFREEIKIKNGVFFETVIKNITRGSQLKANQLDDMISLEPTQYRYITLSDIKDGVISENLPYIKGIDRNMDKHCITNNCFVISKSGKPYKTAIAHVKENEKILANGNLYIIKLDTNKIDPYFLKAFFDSDVALQALENISVGTTVNSIPIDAMKKLVIPLPDIETQKKIAIKYLENMNEVEELKKIIDEKIKYMKTIYAEYELKEEYNS